MWNVQLFNLRTRATLCLGGPGRALSPARLPFDDWFRPGEPRSLIPPSGEGLAGEGSAELGKFVLAYGEEIASC